MMSRILRRQVTTPLENLARAARRMGERLEAPLDLPEPRSDEIGHLTLVIQSLQRQLIDTRDAMFEEASRREGLERHLRAADKLIVVGQLAAGVAHEIGSPLQILVGRARLITEGSDDANVVRQATVIVEQGDRITRTLGRMLDLARKRPPRQELVRVSAELEKVVSLVQTDARHRGVRLAWHPSSTPDALTTDPDEVQQVALNLILNALQATQPGGCVDVRVIATASEVELSVADTGCGIEAERLTHIFDPFHTSRADAGGTGLGLSVVRGILRRTNGHVGVTSEVGRGSTFVVSWPRTGCQ
jgi:signal transduction histidine kinase